MGMKSRGAFLAALLWGVTAGVGTAGAQIVGAVPLPPRAPAKKVVPPPASVAAAPAPAARVAQAASGRPPGSIVVPSKPAKMAQAGAFDSNQRALVDRVSAYLSGVRTMVGNFVQVGPDGKRITGDFYLQKPGKVRFEYDDPSPIQIIADGSSLVVRDRKLATQDLYPLSQTPLRFLLADRLDLLRDTNVVSAGADDVFVNIVIEERSTFAGTNRLMMMFGAKDLQLKQWTVTDPQGYDTTVAVYNLDTTKRPDPDMFRINYERVLQ